MNFAKDSGIKKMKLTYIIAINESMITKEIHVHQIKYSFTEQSCMCIFFTSSPFERPFEQMKNIYV